MSFSFETDDRHVVIAHIGKILDFRNAEAFRTATREQLQEGARHFILDFTGTDLLDSVGLGAIFSLYRHLSPNDGQVVFAGADGAVAVMIELTKIEQIFPSFPDVESARTAFA